MNKAIGCIKRYVVTFVEYGDSVDGKARVLGLYRTHAEALCEMHLAAKRYYEDFGLDTCDILKIDSASVGSTDECGCEYRIDEVEIPVYEGEIKDSDVERNEDGDRILHAYVEIPTTKIKRLNDLMWADKLDYDDLGLKPHENIATFTARFTDGCFADIKVNTGEKDHECYAEAVLFDELGSQIAFSHDVSYELDGPDWILWAGNNEYRIHVIGKDDNETEERKEA